MKDGILAEIKLDLGIVSNARRENLLNFCGYLCNILSI